MEMRHQRKQKELEVVIERLKMNSIEDQKKYQRIIDGKNLEIEKFRMELDDLLDAMLELSKQHKTGQTIK